jgi:hypothetical protein
MSSALVVGGFIALRAVPYNEAGHPMRRSVYLLAPDKGYASRQIRELGYPYGARISEVSQDHIPLTNEEAREAFYAGIRWAENHDCTICNKSQAGCTRTFLIKTRRKAA